jgi:uncharacterized membrane protein
VTASTSPEDDAGEGPAAPGVMLGPTPSVAAYGLSFLVIALFWMGHHRMFRFLVDYDYRLAWLKLFFLLGVAFIPVPTQVIARYGSIPLATVFCAATLALVALLEFFVWRYAARNQQLLRAGTTARRPQRRPIDSKSSARRLQPTTWLWPSPSPSLV